MPHALSDDTALQRGVAAPSHGIPHSRIVPISLLQRLIYHRQGGHAGRGLAGDVLPIPGAVGVFPSGYRASRIDRKRLVGECGPRTWRALSASRSLLGCGVDQLEPRLALIGPGADHGVGVNCISDWLRPTSLAPVLALPLRTRGWWDTSLERWLVNYCRWQVIACP